MFTRGYVLGDILHDWQVGMWDNDANKTMVVCKNLSRWNPTCHTSHFLRWNPSLLHLKWSFFWRKLYVGIPDVEALVDSHSKQSYGKWMNMDHSIHTWFTLWWTNIAMERSTIFNGKIHYFYGHCQLLFVCSPEGINMVIFQGPFPDNSAELRSSVQGSGGLRCGAGDPAPDAGRGKSSGGKLWWNQLAKETCPIAYINKLNLL